MRKTHSFALTILMAVHRPPQLKLKSHKVIRKIEIQIGQNNGFADSYMYEKGYMETYFDHFLVQVKNNKGKVKNQNSVLGRLLMALHIRDLSTLRLSAISVLWLCSYVCKVQTELDLLYWIVI